MLGQKFFIQTEQRSLKYFLEQQIVTPEQQKWVPKLMEYDCEIIYKPEKDNSAVDALSRVVGSPYIDALFTPRTTIWAVIKKAAIIILT